ncbi:hypothetical protein Rcae01_05659 [Novipirellula caenicola]|uniref:Uncharacterized protein n=1 Tax=Novipirellula caenicola TaxID=1536901 RepID=A0ABP9W109_9BACT
MVRTSPTAPDTEDGLNQSASAAVGWYMIRHIPQPHALYKPVPILSSLPFDFGCIGKELKKWPRSLC